jgi:aryl-alcohol dehydrogenase-like predicted oxidoreductase
MYGEAEEVVGDLLRDINFTPKPFVATKVWTEGRKDGIEQMAKSAQLLRTPKIDLIQIHNLVDWRTHLKTLRRMKEEGKIRYIGITHYTDWGQAELAAIIGSNQFDFVQTEYAIDTRKAEQRLLPLARDKGTAVIINRPFQRGSLFRAVRGQKLPLWAADFQCKSWGQFFLKFVLSHPAVTCTIPGTSKPKHMRDNVQAGLGRLPNEKERQKMVAFLEKL